MIRPIPNKTLKNIKFFQIALKPAEIIIENVLLSLNTTVKRKKRNQRLKAKDAENKIEILQRNIGITTLLVLLTVGYFWYRRRKNVFNRKKNSR
jgi:hypothetical protein